MSDANFVQAGKFHPIFNDGNRDGNYTVLEAVLYEAYAHAAFGKGKERHGTDEPFDKQITVLIERLGLTYCEGQAVKKIVEAHRTGSKADYLGAINYIAAHLIATILK